MQRRKVAENVGGGVDVEKVAGEVIASSTTPTCSLNNISVSNVQSQLPQYITSPVLNTVDLDQTAQDYFTTSPGTQSLGSSGATYNYTIPEPDWPAPSYISATTSSAPFTVYRPLAGYEFMSPQALTEDVPAFSDYELFPLISGDACMAAAGSGSVPTSPPTSPGVLYSSQLVKPATGRPNYTPSMPRESNSFRGCPQTVKQGVVPLDPSIARPGYPSLNFEGDKAVADCGAGNKVQLRTALRKAKPKRRQSHPSSPSGKKSGQDEEEDREDPLTPEERRARHSHNIVEKQYRNRLNAQFVRLLSVLPAEQRNGSSGEDGTASDAPTAEDKRLSKAEVLDLAMRRIKALEEDRRRLEEENGQLVNNVDAMTSNMMNRSVGKRG